MKLSHKLAAAFAATLFGAIAAGLFGIFTLNRSIDTYARVIQVDDANERASAAMLVDFKIQVQEWKNTLLRGKDPKQLDKYWDAFQKHERHVNESAKKLLASLPEGEARTLVEKFVQAHTTMGEGYRKGFEAFKASGFDPMAGDASVKGMDRAPAELLDHVGEKIVARNASAVAEAGESSKRAMVISLALMLAACVVGVGTGVMVSRSITRQIGGEPDHAVAVANEIAKGNLCAHVEAREGDSASLLAAMKVMRDNLAAIVGQVRQSSDSIATGSAQIATGNADLSQRTEEQSSNLQQTAASMEQLTSTVKNNADTARAANQLASSASDVATQGGVVVGQVVQTMGEITTASKKIADITGVIDSIAFQTNILALNAAVEAARAGEQGRGFAVVASEVRNLAQRSAEAAREIKVLIGNSVERVETGSKLVGDAGRTMDDIVAQVKRVNDLIGEITSATTEQTTGISQVSEAVTQLDHVTQQNAALVEESSAAAESLKEQASRLVSAVAVFKIAQA